MLRIDVAGICIYSQSFIDGLHKSELHPAKGQIHHLRFTIAHYRHNPHLKDMLQRYLFSLLLFTVSLHLKGFVYDSSNEPVIGANIYWSNQKKGPPQTGRVFSRLNLPVSMNT